MALSQWMILWDTLAQSEPCFVAMRWLQRPSIQDKPAVGGLVESLLLSHQTGTEPLQTLLVSDLADSSSEPGCVWLPIKVLGLAALSESSSQPQRASRGLSGSDWPRQCNPCVSHGVMDSGTGGATFIMTWQLLLARAERAFLLACFSVQRSQRLFWDKR